ncbi:MAG: DUF2442 domain-containing protein [Deltaproteobacteria bacterium]|nr:DUF2442 domain-containing protein [Deltaproteobacteria bacterium]
MFKPVEVKALPNYKLWVKFSDRIEGEVDLSPLVGKGVFSLWKDSRAFQNVHIGAMGEITWNDQVELCPDSIYMKITHKTAEELFPNLEEEVVRA